ncbi:hypothetical protein FA95DRAFT_543744 [Auriscalpium vulgare]|uniref:Uncharacterized protein n=1 Tax=Auriscalpium vulgare TaxID=40419 RepID=A0ACB8RF53_9AGAM|nr:hypothetical protein FA95DRAFT_543744 [Auriscalpium vulgare]
MGAGSQWARGPRCPGVCRSRGRHRGRRSHGRARRRKAHIGGLPCAIALRVSICPGTVHIRGLAHPTSRQRPRASNSHLHIHLSAPHPIPAHPPTQPRIVVEISTNERAGTRAVVIAVCLADKVRSGRRVSKSATWQTHMRVSLGRCSLCPANHSAARPLQSHPRAPEACAPTPAPPRQPRTRAPEPQAHSPPRSPAIDSPNVNANGTGTYLPERRDAFDLLFSAATHPPSFHLSPPAELLSGDVASHYAPITAIFAARPPPQTRLLSSRLVCA